jgi:hypothetical protein
MDPTELELPEPSDPQPSVPPINDDEFLSQLAGQEIERLLAEVDNQIDAALAAEAAAQNAPTAPALALRKYPEPLTRPALPDVVEGQAQEPKSSFIWDDPQEPPLAARADMFGAFAAEAPLPAYLRPLEWLNAPFEGISGTALGVIGKLAIVSFIAAVGAFVYVMMIR